MIGQVVAGIDGSLNSLTAFQYALDLARRVKAGIKVVFVVDSRKTELPIIYTASHFDYGFERVYIPPEPGLKSFYDKVRQDIRSFAENCLALCKRDAEGAKVPFVSVVREGLPSGILAEEARSGDLLVIGRKGENAHIERAIVGSTTEDAVRSCPRPVLVCPSTFRAPTRVLFPYDGSPVAEGALLFCVNAFGGIWEEMVVLTVTEEIEESFPYDTELGYLGTHGIPYRLVMEAGVERRLATAGSAPHRPHLEPHGTQGALGVFNRLGADEIAQAGRKQCDCVRQVSSPRGSGAATVVPGRLRGRRSSSTHRRPTGST